MSLHSSRDTGPGLSVISLLSAAVGVVYLVLLSSAASRAQVQVTTISSLLGQRWQTQGTYFLAFNTLLNGDYLDARKMTAPSKPESSAQQKGKQNGV